jgi:hypothetical protein
MTFTPEHDLAEHPRWLVLYADGGEDVIAVPQCTLAQGPPSGWISFVRLVAHEWMADGFIRHGQIVGVKAIFAKSRRQTEELRCGGANQFVTNYGQITSELRRSALSSGTVFPEPIQAHATHKARHFAIWSALSDNDRGGKKRSNIVSAPVAGAGT